jgi:DNA-binding CsgD family transcriptional regulator
LVCVAEMLAAACEADGVIAEWTPVAQMSAGIPGRAYQRKPAGDPLDGLCLEATSDAGSLRVTLVRSLGRPRFDARMIDHLKHLRPAALACLSAPSHSVQPPLSPAENEVLDHLVQGSTIQQTADALGRSPNTVHSHAKSIYRKLGIRTRAELIARFQSVRSAQPHRPMLDIRHGATHTFYAARMTRPPEAPSQSL